MLLLAAGCGGSGSSTTSRPAVTATPTVAVAPADTADCPFVVDRLRRVTLALTASSALVAHATNRGQLVRRIGIERVQLGRSAALIAAGPTPPPLAGNVRALAAALRDFSHDFARAETLAAGGDVAGASAAMADRPVVGRIVSASRAIESACR